jgi:serralysin
MGAAITGLAIVDLANPTTFTANATAGLGIEGSAAGGDTIVLGAASQSVTGGGTNEHIKATAANAGAAISGLGANSTLEITTGGAVTLNSATDVATVKLDAASMLMLNAMQFITAIGSTGNDTIQAGAANQTLSGGIGSDMLIGYSGGGDLFSDTAAGLNGDLLKSFLPSDTIDITNLARIGASLTAVTSGGNTKVTVVSGTAKSVFTIAGTWSQSGFQLHQDTTGTGTFITHS